MRANLTVTEQARRAQIVAAAIETIAELGHARASFAKIAERAGLSSTGLISYHFRSRGALMAEVLGTVTAAFTEYVVAEEDDGTAAGALRAFLLANIGFMRDHRSQVVAMLRVAEAVSGGDDGGLAVRDRAALAALLAKGRDAGEFRAFDADLMAGFVLSLRNGVIMRAAAEPGFDLDACGRELLATVDLATRP
ncbi:TetR/AcrR family transcriptional regulator [Actinorhabdospora filicis]|nr:TetR/AcrR family transcriptional regulator [Actinorhabdospora filicis]